VGDQFTAGTGASERFSYPRILEKETKATILNLGQSGRGAGDVMAVLKPALNSSRVKLVVLTIGFNDLQQGSDLRFLTGYLTETISTLERYKIPLMLVAIPALPYKGASNPHPVFDQLASSYKFIYEPNAFIDVLKTPANMETPSQFTAEGYRVFASNIEVRLRKEGFLR
jgi:lysophospholipase L1-like esterase